MLIETLDILRCPFCGGRLSLVESEFHRTTPGSLQHGILGCHCCVFPVIDDIPVLHLQPAATAARDQLKAGRPDLARRTMFGIDDDGRANAIDAIASAPGATYRQALEAFGPALEGRYFLYRFSDPTYVVAEAVIRAVAATVLDGRRRAIDMCGGSGHVTRALLDRSSPAPVLADLSFAKLWLARRFTAPGCQPVCCDGNGALPFARGAFGLALCIDAIMYVWTKRQLVGELTRLVAPRGAVVVGHAHNERTWSPSYAQPLSPGAYADLFETIEPRVFAEAGLFADVVSGGPLDLSRRDARRALDCDPALWMIATPDADVFVPHTLPRRAVASGEFRLNPLYSATRRGDRVDLRLCFPSEEYEQEYGHCRQYLPDDVAVEAAALEHLPATTLPDGLADLARRRVLLDLPKHYY